jgi:hypothetical protein
MTEKSSADNNLVLTEREALDFFSFLISAARTQMDDPASYASMRLLDAAERLRGYIRERVSAKASEFLTSTAELSTRAMIYMDDRDAYISDLDELNRFAARFLLEIQGSKEDGNE